MNSVSLGAKGIGEALRRGVPLKLTKIYNNVISLNFIVKLYEINEVIGLNISAEMDNEGTVL